MQTSNLKPATNIPGADMLAPELQVSQWFNTETPITLDSLKGRVVMLYAFQMLCPSCVLHSIPQAVALHNKFGSEVAIVGLHTVFEHHEAMAPHALHAFLQEFRVRFPVGVDTPSNGKSIPVTMRTYALSGTPSLVLLDKAGRIRLHYFGHLSDLELGLSLGKLLAETDPHEELTRSNEQASTTAGNCNETGCVAPQH